MYMYVGPPFNPTTHTDTHTHTHTQPTPQPPSGVFPWAIFAFAWLGWTFDFLDLVLLGFMKTEVAKDLRITEREEAWMLGELVYRGERVRE
jgi:hypothetical protein